MDNTYLLPLFYLISFGKQSLISYYRIIFPTYNLIGIQFLTAVLKNYSVFYHYCKLVISFCLHGFRLLIFKFLKNLNEISGVNFEETLFDAIGSTQRSSLRIYTQYF